MAETTFISDFRRNFLAGLAALFPILITVFLLSWLYGQIDRTIGRKINGLCREIVVKRPPLFKMVFPRAPEEVVEEFESRGEYAQEHFPGFVGVSIGILAMLVCAYLIGFALRGYVGRRVVSAVDRFFLRFPFIKAIYPHARQVADLLFGEHRPSRFRRVVAVQYPRLGVYSLGFLTGTGLKDVEQDAQQYLVTVFIPTSPTPLTGFVIVVPRHDIIELDMSVEEAFRFCMTAGLVATDKQRPGQADRDADVSVGTLLRRAILERKAPDRSEPTRTER